MNNAELAQNVILETVKSSGADGATEGEIVSELVRKHRINYHDALSLVQNNLAAAGVEQHKGSVIRYRMPQIKEKKQDSPAMELARKSAQRKSREIASERILDHYRHRGR